MNRSVAQSGTQAGIAERTSWIAVDWGTSNLRASAICSQGEVIASLESDQGMSVLEPHAYEAALLFLISCWLCADVVTDVLCCGMVGSRQGWREAPYRTTPCEPLDPAHMVPIPTRDRRIDVRVVPGIQQFSPPDVMRGEETQIAGFLANNRNFHGIVCLPGTHCKWVEIASGEIRSFRSTMTGELFSLLATQSVLRHSVAADGWSDMDFGRGISAALEDPAAVTTHLFSIRAGHLLGQLNPVSARSYLSGLLIGQEIAVLQSYWQAQPIVIIGAGKLADRYRAAFEMTGTSAELIDVASATLAGLIATRKYS